MANRFVALASLTVLAVAAFGPAQAEDRVDLTPPLYREQARATASVRPAAEIGTTPRLVPSEPESPRAVIEAAAVQAR